MCIFISCSSYQCQPFLSTYPNMAPYVALELLNNPLVAFWRRSDILPIRTGTVHRFHHRQERILHALLDKISWLDWYLLYLYDLLISRSLVFNLDLTCTLCLKFFLKVFYFQIHDYLYRRPDIVKDSEPRHSFEARLFFFKQVFGDVVQLSFD